MRGINARCYDLLSVALCVYKKKKTKKIKKSDVDRYIFSLLVQILAQSLRVSGKLEVKCAHAWSVSFSPGCTRVGWDSRQIFGINGIIDRAYRFGFPRDGGSLIVFCFLDVKSLSEVIRDVRMDVIVIV